MSKWMSGPRQEKPSGPKSTPQETYLALERIKYAHRRFADLGALFSGDFIELARDETAHFDYADLPAIRIGEEVDGPVSDPAVPPGRLGRAALAMSTAEIAAHLTGLSDIA